MKKQEGVLRGIVLTAALLAAGSWVLAHVRTSDAGDTFGDGHCFSVPPSCIDGYTQILSDQESFRIRDVRGDSSWWSALYEAPLDDAEVNWALNVGPQAASEFVQPFQEPWARLLYDNFYHDCRTEGDPLDRCDDPAVHAYVCHVTPEHDVTCSSADRIVSSHSRTYMDSVDFPTLGSLSRTNVMAHEMGHVLLLGHHLDSGCLMYPFVTAIVGPTACDRGSAYPLPPEIVAPCDGEQELYGIRCMFGWWREQYPTLADCPDLNRDGTVSLSDDILEAILAHDTYDGAKLGLGGAGEPRYHPDADLNKDGSVDLANDILGTILAYQADCDSDFYPNA